MSRSFQITRILGIHGHFRARKLLSLIHSKIRIYAVIIGFIIAGLMPLYIPTSLAAQDTSKEDTSEEDTSIAQHVLNSSQSDPIKLFQNESYYDFKLYLSFIKVGTARLQFTELKSNPLNSDQEAKLQIHFTAQSDPLLKSIYPIDFTIESTVSKTNFKPYFYEKHLKQGNEYEHSKLSFDWEARKIYEIKNDIPTNPLKLVDDCQDPLSLILSLCLNDFQKNPYSLQNVTDGGKIIKLESRLSGTEAVHSPVGSLYSHRIDIETKDLRGVFKKSSNAKVSLYLHKLDSALPAIPVKLESKVAIGSFYAVLSGGMHRGHIIHGIKPIEPRPNIRSRDRIFRKF